MATVLGWVQRRWNDVLEPVVSCATVAQVVIPMNVEHFLARMVGFWREC
ncbi:hypothetical protein KSC_026910 [Ktedonobacter sp. SOSP1-52]|nr:hypothetical protein [Ktedonobacter sp. SOSP1-52]GHO63799.1 hypothetical protein KSC_026910 [Ktedonobacter sp. SOSP1-52]